ncbi:hypothetical protein QUF76_10270 [Desulfobacterales bacterium HSG16]|nr:hypothetical protein [Desulfobacterales bacterium HSG16]
MIFNRIYDFKLDLSSTEAVRIKESETSKKQSKAVKVISVNTEDILSWSLKKRERLKAKLDHLVPAVFPRMPEDECREYVNDYFTTPAGQFIRHALLFKTPKNDLIASSLFDLGIVEYKNQNYNVVNSILRAVLPSYQDAGLGKIMGKVLLSEVKPDVLFSNTYQSSSLHAWIRLITKYNVSGYEVWPRLEKTDQKEFLITLPEKDFDLIFYLFKQTYFSFIKDWNIVDREAANLTVQMVRKNTHPGVFDFSPWKKNGREDRLASLLDAGERDGILVVFRKTV